jgi:ferric-dicitrate binding protein FerR (iron transport regulator)
MKPESHRDIFEDNVERLLQAAAGQGNSPFQERLVRTVGQEVHAQRRAARVRLLRRVWPPAIAAAAVVALTLVLVQPKAEGLDWVQPLYGAVEVMDSDSPRPVVTSEPVHAGQSIRTRSGSKAQILARDGSKVVVLPRTALQIIDGRKGPALKLQEGTITIEAAKQHDGRRLAVETPGARIRTLGTVFEVRLVQRPDGTRQTRVDVTSGLVELESAGDKVLLGANTEGLAEEGRPPERQLADSDLNALLGLDRQTVELAQRLGRKPGLPAILQVRHAEVAALWTMVSGSAWRPAGNEKYVLHLKSPAARARLFTLDGREVPVRRQGRDLEIDGSAVSPGLPTDTRLILQLQEVKGILRVENGEMVRFVRPAGAGNVVTLFQFRLPGQTHIAHVVPEPQEITTTSNRTTLTIAADVEGPEVWE